MASRLKERGGGGGKVMALQLPQRSALDGTPQGKLAARRAPSVVKEHRGRTPVSGKENARAVSRGKIAPGVAQRLEGGEVGEKVQVAPVGVRWSTSSMPRGKSSNPSDFSRLMADFRARGGAQGRHSVAAVPVIEGKEKVATREPRNVESPAICRVAGRFQQPRKTVAPKDTTVASTNVLRLTDISKSSNMSSSNLRRSVSRPRGSNFEKIGEKTLIKHADNSIVTGNAEQIQKKSFPKKKECLKVVESSSNGKINVAHDVESSERDSDRTVFLEAVKQNVLLPPVLENHDESDPLAVHLNQSHRMQSSGVHAKIQNLAEVACIKSSSTDTVDNVTVSKILMRKESEGGKAPPTSIKLHEKLAYLEGKVQKIASDIKRTKDMLESNDPAASKLLLSNIQSKISGIEEVVTNVIGSVDPESKFSFPMKDETREITGLRNSAKEFNPEELEARFFPHHKLLRNRTSTVNEILVKDRSLSPAEENPIALEFLAGLEVEKSNPNESVEIQHTGSGASASSSSENLLSNIGIDSRDKSFASMLATDEKIEDFDDQENKPASIPKEEIEDPALNQLFEIGSKSSTGGWFVSEGEAALLAHSDGSCSYFDIANNEGKSEFNPPVEISSNMWGDCWLIRAPGVDGCAGRYVVAASAGNSLGSGFCSWDFYSKKVSAFRIEESKTTSTTTSLSSASSLSRAVLAPLPSTLTGAQQWWYRPCGPLLVAASSGLRKVNAFDIRDGEMVMTWSLQNPVTSMEYSSPMQWRSRGKVVIAESETIRLWDVNALSPQPLLSIAAGKKVNSLHVNNTDAELGGGVRQRISSSEVEGNDGSFSTDEEVNVVDLRLPSGIGLKMPKKPGVNARESIFSRGDSIYLGCTESTPSSSAIHQFSLRKGKMGASYKLPKVNAHASHAALTQVWGNSDLMMGVCGMGLFVFDDVVGGGGVDSCQVFGPDDLCHPSFDFLGSRVLLISRDRPAMWRYLY